MGEKQSSRPSTTKAGEGISGKPFQSGRSSTVEAPPEEGGSSGRRGSASRKLNLLPSHSPFRGTNRDSSSCVCSLLLHAGAKASPAAAPANSASSGSVVFLPLAPALSEDSVSGSQGQFGTSHQEALASVTAQTLMILQAANSSSCTKLPLNSSIPSTSSAFQPISQQQRSEPLLEDHFSTSESEQDHFSDQKSQSVNVVERKLPADYYNWRKYGEKQVKGIACSRSYYRCSHANCDVKKNVLHCYSGHVIEIMYKGRHNHDPPQKNRYRCESRVSFGNPIGKSESANLPSERINKSNSHPPRKEQSSGLATSEQQLHYPSDCDGGSGIRVEYDDEPEPKRRMLKYLTPLLKSSGESKVVVQTASDLGMLVDGYKWRKYGQKIVKGNPNPRSYYKCTFNGCPVRKHVERASDDAKAFVMTYEGKHNHEPPNTKKDDPNAPVVRNKGEHDQEPLASEKDDMTAHVTTDGCRQNDELPTSENSNISQRTALLIAAAAVVTTGGQLTTSNHIPVEEFTAQLASEKEDDVSKKAMDLGGEKALESARTLLSISSS